MIDYARSIPVMPSPSIAESRDFYCGRLGFGVVAEMND